MSLSDPAAHDRLATSTTAERGRLCVWVARFEPGHHRWRRELAARVGGDLTQSFLFTSSALGETLTLGPITWSLPVHAVSDVVQVFKDQCEKKCGAWAKQKLQALTDAAYAWIKANVGSSPETLAYLLKWAGVGTTQIANALMKYTGLSITAAAQLLSDLF